ncbi:DEAD/DEAH box helicase [Staphylococcus argensis]|uniref:DNA 3'-5' helicase n=1 Tax=Staphylococcus argensis TaxID=1607738 RepID=A0A2K4FAT2_9STAP|nr:DEAD/DEAH box helicase [Staphylococcus argensis]MCY6991379.1 helicase-related protein [Staphylococcus argensis]POA08386.1 ATP-dependent DNA helicase RecQ [Staphylococcus argensis]
MNLNELINDRQEKFFVLVGFTSDELTNTPNKLLNLSIIDGMNEYIYDPSKKPSPELFGEFFSTNSKSWITYEEFFILKGFIETAISKDDIVFVYNNKYLGLYPFNYSFEGIDEFYEKLFSSNSFDTKTSDIEETVTELYTNIKKINDNYYVAINQQLFENYNVIDLYTSKRDLELLKEISHDDYDYSFDANKDPEAIVNLVNYLQATDNKVIVLTLPSEVKNHFSLLANIYNSHKFIYYQPHVKQRIVARENQYLEILNKYWGYNSFRELDIYEDIHTRKLTKISQAQIIDEIVEQMKIANNKETPKDIFITSSTGAGKSIMFQLPSLYINNNKTTNKKLTIVISPLIGLMNDQVENLNKMNVKNAKTINSGISPTEKANIAQDIKEGKIDILYVSIETLINKGDIQTLIGEREIGLFVVDEAHTVTTWGRTFRVDYWFMGSYINKLRKNYNFPVVTFTATAIVGGPEDMYTEIKRSLNLVSPIRYIGSIKKENVFLNINTIDDQTKKKYGNDAKQIKDKLLISRIEKNIKNKKKTLIYFPTVVSINQFKNTLEAYNPKAYENVAIYHGQLSSEDKNINFRNFKSGEQPIILATKAFGMGIDIPDIEEVYHYAISGNVLDYIQEIGRVARKKERGMARLDYIPNKDFNDFKRLRALSSIKKGQLLSVMDKIKSIYKESGNKRYLTINVESFNYIFNNDFEDTDDIENKVKLALLTIENDFKQKMNYPPFVTRPGSLNSKDYLLATEANKNYFETSKYSRYFRFVEEIKNSHYKYIFIFDTEKYWQDHYQTISFPQFKFKVGQASDEIKYDPVLNKLNFSLSYIVNFTGFSNEEELQTNLNNIIRKVEDALREFASKQCYFTERDLSQKLMNVQLSNKRESYRLSSLIINTLIQINSLLGLRDIEVATNETYKISNNYEDLLSKLKETFSNLINKTGKCVEGNIVRYYIFKNSNKEKIDHINILLGFAEGFGLIDFEMKGGATPSVGIRMNAISQLDKALSNPGKYRNTLLENQYKSFIRNIEMFKYLFTLPSVGENPSEKITNYTKQFWSTIEDYFFGIIPSKVEKEVIQKLYNR